VPRTSALSAEESAAQKEFKKAYKQPRQIGARKDAIALLANAYHLTSWQLLASAAVSDPDDSVRLAAFTMLAQEPARTNALAHMLAQCFSAVKPADTDLRLA